MGKPLNDDTPAARKRRAAAKGGKAAAQTRDMRALGRKGGRTTVARYGRQYFREIRKKAGKKRGNGDTDTEATD